MENIHIYNTKTELTFVAYRIHCHAQITPFLVLMYTYFIFRINERVFDFEV